MRTGDVEGERPAGPRGTCPPAAADSDLPENPPALRELTAPLYGGDELARIRQEILLGIGGMRALRALGIRPTVLHLYEGHSAFAILERIRERVEEDGLSFEDAWRATTIQTIFTTHMKHSILTLAWRFNADRMVLDYARAGYLPAAGGIGCV